MNKVVTFGINYIKRNLKKKGKVLKRSMALRMETTSTDLLMIPKTKLRRKRSSVLIVLPNIKRMLIQRKHLRSQNTPTD